MKFDQLHDRLSDDKEDYTKKEFPKGHRKEMTVMLMHMASRQFAWARWSDEDQVWRVEFRGETITMPNLQRVSDHGFEFAGGGGGGGGSGGEKLPMPKNIEVRVNR